jgi:two-component system OmpR family response regulator
MTGSRSQGTTRPRSLTRTGLGSAWQARILVVDDEPALAELIDRTLRVAGFESHTAGSRAQALSVAAEFEPELALIDVMLPDGSGFDLCHQLRALLPDLAVIFITAKDSLGDKLTGLNLGGDDYITKPFSVTEVVARVNAVLRRLRPEAGQSDSRLVMADLILDDDGHVVTRAGRAIELSPTEFRLLRFLLEQAGRVMSKQQILAHVWDYDFPGDPGVVEKFVSQLRKKISDDEERLIHTVRGFGYVMRVSA